LSRIAVAVIEFARNVCDLEDANSEEFDKDAKHQVVVNMPEVSTTHLGGTMRLGLRPTIFQKGTETWSKIRKLYEDAQSISGDDHHVYERHRHRYEVNPSYVEILEAKGLHFIGRDETGKRMEIMELEDHPFYVATQYHPEYLSRPLKPSPPFLGFVKASAECSIKSVVKISKVPSSSKGSLPFPGSISESEEIVAEDEDFDKEPATENEVSKKANSKAAASQEINKNNKEIKRKSEDENINLTLKRQK